jgi:hypothetical protein
MVAARTKKARNIYTLRAKDALSSCHKQVNLALCGKSATKAKPDQAFLDTIYDYFR